MVNLDNLFNNKIQLAVVLAVGLLALSFVGTQTGFAPYAPADVCTDSDGGDITRLGVCTDNDEVSGDVCVSETEVVENSCYFNQCVSTIVSCQLGKSCVQGRCIDPALLV
ncbi:MAG: hypothetical protein J4445_00435 [DPANN group archaeon]|nr:hypothetical protein [DPANN group archaeon]